MKEKLKFAFAVICASIAVGCLVGCTLSTESGEPVQSGQESTVESERESASQSEEESATPRELAEAAIAALPDAQDITLADEDAVLRARALFDALTEEEASSVGTERLEAAEAVIAGLKKSAYTGERSVYVAKGAACAELPLSLKENGVSEAVLRGREISLSYRNEGDKIVLGEDFASMLVYGANPLRLTDGNGDEFTFVVYSAVAPGDIAFFDFDVNGYANDDPYAVPSVTDDGGIDGKTLHLKKDSAGGNLFGFFADGANGMAEFHFQPDTEYRMYFDVKVLPGTSSEWWSPVRFGDNGDVIYLYDDYSWKNPDVNVLYTQTTVTENEDGSRRVTAIFRTSENCRSLDIPNWGGAVDLLLDNVCVEKLNPDVERIACVGDSITEASNTDFSYPEQLQAMLGYEDYFVFNFGKSASNVLLYGIYPYRTWAEWQYGYLKRWNPDVIVMMLGTNDGRFTTGISDYKDKKFIEDYLSLAEEFRGMCDRFYINVSPYAFGDEYGIRASDVNGRIVNIQGYVAYESGIDVIDVHAAVKAVSRADYFPDYIHGNDAGYGVIAQAVLKGLAGEKTVTRYHLLYALQTAADKTTDAYAAAEAVSKDPSATQEEIDGAYLSIRDGMKIPELEETRILDRNGYAVSDGKSVLLPVVVRNEEVVSLYVAGKEINRDKLSLTEEGILVPLDELGDMTKGAYKAELELSRSGRIEGILYPGFGEGEALLIDSTVNRYVNDNEWLMPNEIGTEFDGACMHFFRKDRDVTILGVDSLASFGFIRFTFRRATRYTLSFDYKFGAGTAGTSFFYFGDAEGTRICDWSVPDGVSVYNNASGAVAAILPKGEGYFFTVSFTTPDTDGNISLNLPSWFTDLDLYIDNFFLCEGENVSVDLSGKPVLTEREIYADGNSSVTVPVRACGAVLKGVVLDGTPTEGYTADGEGVVLSAETVSSLGTGAFPCKLVYEKDTLPFILYVGYAPGEIYCLDNVVNRYVNANEWMWKNEIVDGKAGRKWLHLYNEAAWLTILGIDANASFGWIRFAFKPATTYTLSYDFYYDNIWSQPMSGSTRIVLSDSYTLCTLGADYSVTKGDAVSVGVENRGEYYTLSVTFVTPQTGNINLQIPGSFSNGSVYLSRLILREEKTAD